MNTDSKNNSINNGIAAILFVALPVLLSLYFENGYFNITQAKLHIFAFLAIPALIALLAVFTVKAIGHSIERLDIREWFLLIFAALSFISSALSTDFEKSFLGTGGWCVGSFTIISAALILILVSRNLNYSHNLWLPIIAVADVVFLIGILQFSGIDVFSMHKGVAEGTYFYYISTIGNVNRFAGYLSLLFPLLLVFFISSDKKASILIHFSSLVLCTVCVVISASDSAYLGIGFSMFFAFPFIFKNAKRTFRTFLTLSVYGTLLSLTAVLPCYAPLREQANGIAAVLFDLRISLPIVISGILGCIITLSLEKKYSKKYAAIQTLIFEIILGAAALYLIFKTVFQFDDSWGSYRGLIWRSSIDSFKNFSVSDKLFGIGPEMFEKICPNVNEVFGIRVLTAHSEPLQILLSNGVFGIVFYIGLWTTIFVDFFRKKVYNNNCIAFYIPLCAYFAQSLVNSATVINISILIIIACCYIISTKNINKNGGI